MSEFGKMLLVFGAIIMIAGAVIWAMGRLGAPRLPGDFVFRKGGVTFYFPIATSIIVSVILTLLLNLLLRRR